MLTVHASFAVLRSCHWGLERSMGKSAGCILQKHFLNPIWQDKSACEHPHRLLLVKAPSLLHFYTVPLCWAIVFFKHSLTGRQRQRHSLSVLGESGDPRSSLGPRRTRGADGRRSMLPLTQPAWMLNCRTTERILICSNRMGVRRAASPASVNHSSPPEINAITPIFIDS